MKKNVIGEEHRDDGTSYKNLRGFYRTLKQSNEAKEYHEKALISRKRLSSGQEHRDVAESYSNLERVYKALRQYTEAKEYHQKGLIIMEKNFGEEDDDATTSLSSSWTTE